MSAFPSTDDFGLPQEFGTYGKISGLSGGQKVKLVLAAALWNAPHLLILSQAGLWLCRAAHSKHLSLASG